MADEFFSDDADLDMEQVREDYAYIWGKNIIQVELIRQENPQAGDYFREGESKEEIRRTVWLNVQGVSTDAYSRMQAGIVTPEATYSCYAKHDEDIRNLDIVKLGTFLFRVQEHNKSFYSGQIAFQKFNLKKIDSEN